MKMRVNKKTRIWWYLETTDRKHSPDFVKQTWSALTLKHYCVQQNWTLKRCAIQRIPTPKLLRNCRILQNSNFRLRIRRDCLIRPKVSETAEPVDPAWDHHFKLLHWHVGCNITVYNLQIYSEGSSSKCAALIRASFWIKYKSNTCRGGNKREVCSVVN